MDTKILVIILVAVILTIVILGINRLSFNIRRIKHVLEKER